MPRYLVKKFQDAVHRWDAAIDADTPQAAQAKAQADDCTWIDQGISHYDDTEIPLDDVEAMQPGYDLNRQTPTVFVVTIDHKHGSNVDAFATRDLAVAAVATFARTWWNQELGADVEIPADDQDCIDAYFAAMEGREYHSIVAAPVHGADHITINDSPLG